MTPTFLVSRRMVKQTKNRIFDLLADADRFDAMAHRIHSDPNRPSNWRTLWRHSRSRAADERRWAAATAKGMRLDFNAVAAEYVRRKGRHYAS
jgi:hypothetical protein